MIQIRKEFSFVWKVSISISFAADGDDGDVMPCTIVDK